MPRRVGLHEDYSLLCICAIVFGDTADFRAGLYRAPDFDHCGSDRACVIEGLNKIPFVRYLWQHVYGQHHCDLVCRVI